MKQDMLSGKCPRCGVKVEEAAPTCEVCGLRIAQTTGETSPSFGLTTAASVKVPSRNKQQAGLPAVFAALGVLAITGTAAVAGIGKSNNTLASAGIASITAQQMHVAQATATSPAAKALEPTVAVALPSSNTPALIANAAPAESKQAPVQPLATATAAPPVKPADQPASTTDVPTRSDVASVQLAALPAEQQVATTRVLPGVGSTASDLQGWSVRLDGTDNRPQLWSNDPYTKYKPKGTFWLVYLVYRNTGDKAQALGRSISFSMKDAQGNLYPELSSGGKNPDMAKIARAEQANPIDAAVEPHRQTSTLLVFDLPAGTQPSLLLAYTFAGTALSPTAPVAWTLGQK